MTASHLSGSIVQTVFCGGNVILAATGGGAQVEARQRAALQRLPVSRVPAQMWAGWAQFRAQMWAG